MKKVIKIIFRLIALPFFAMVGLVSALRLWLNMVRNFILYGGEAIAHSKDDKITIRDIYNELKKQHEKP